MIRFFGLTLFGIVDPRTRLGQPPDHVSLIFIEVKKLVMDEKKSDYVLPNGYTYIAVSMGIYGVWAKAIDPITAIKNVFNQNGKDNYAVYVLYAKDGEVEVDSYWGGYTYNDGHEPMRVGIYKVTAQADDVHHDHPPIIEPVKQGDFNKDHDDCREWILEVQEEFEDV